MRTFTKEMFLFACMGFAEIILSIPFIIAPDPHPKEITASVLQNRQAHFNSPAVPEAEQLLMNAISRLEKMQSTTDMSIDEVTARAETFYQLAAVVEETSDIANATVVELRKTLRKRLAITQRRQFPLLRSRFGVLIGSKFKVDETSVNTSGIGKNSLHLVNFDFALVRQTAKVQKEIHSSLMLLRFKRSCYQWHKEALAAESTIYHLQTRHDGAITSIY